jgi:hypothetical protein
VGFKAKSGQLPVEKPLIFDHIFQPELDQWTKWDDLIPIYEHDRSKRFTELLVPTIDTVRLGMMRTRRKNIFHFRYQYMKLQYDQNFLPDTKDWWD